MRTAALPEGAEVVRSYAQYEQHVDAFFHGRYHLMVVIGRPGLSKSHAFEDRLGPTSHLIRGWAAPLQAYMETYRHRNELLIFDDAETLWKRPGGRVLLRSLCEFKSKKLIQWTSTAYALAKARIPQSFLTSSKVAVIANRFMFGEADEYEAILDRGHLIHFDPTPVEVHARVGNWFWDQEVYDYIGERLHLLSDISARLYMKVWERKQAGGDWQKLLTDAYCHAGTMRFVQALETDSTCKGVEDRVKKFIAYSGACRATYFNLKRELKERNQLHAFKKTEVPKLQLRCPPPAEPNVDEEVARAKEEAERAEEEGEERTDMGESSDGALPGWQQYSNDPNDYNSFSDYVDDWWKRPRPPEQDEDDANDPPPGTTDPLIRLRCLLADAVKREDYERAAELRNRIQQVEAKRKHG